MTDDTQYPEDAERRELDQRYARALAAENQVTADALAAKERLPELRQQLGEMVWRHALGEADEAEVNAARWDILYAERAIEAADLITKPARAGKFNLEGKTRKLGMRRQNRVDFENLKQSVTDSPALLSASAERLRNLSTACNGNADAAEEFITAQGRP